MTWGPMGRGGECPECKDLLAERDRLAAENAELQRACNALSDELSTLHQLELEAKCHDDLEKSHAIMVQVVAERDATLDRLRELVGPGRTISNATCMKMVDILYPPEIPNEDR